MKHFKLYKRLTEDVIDDMVSGDSKTYDSNSLNDKGYTVNTIRGETDKGNYRDFNIVDEHAFALNKQGGITSDPYFKYQIKTDSDNLKSSNYFYTVFWDGEFPYFNYGAISTSESEIYKILKERDIDYAVIGKYTVRNVTGKNKYSYVYQEINPLESSK